MSKKSYDEFMRKIEYIKNLEQENATLRARLAELATAHAVMAVDYERLKGKTNGVE